MKIICNQKNLAAKISIVQKAISSKTTIDILKGICLKAKNGEVILTGYDLEIGIQVPLQTEVIEEGDIVINSKLFGDIIRKLPDEQVEISTDSGNIVYINCGNSKFTIKGDSANDYPKLPEVVEEELLEIKQSKVREIIKETVFATTQDPTKPILMGCLIEVTDGKISSAAIDGYRLAVRSEYIEANDKSIRVVIPGKTLIDISALATDEDNNMQIGFSDRNAIFIINETKIVSRLLEGDFIDYKKLLPKEHLTQVKVNTKGFMNCIERASLLSESEKNNLIKLAIRENNIIITSNTERGNVIEEIETVLSGELLDIAFNSRYLLDALKVINSDYITMDFTTNVNPCIIKPVSSTEYTYLLLPVRVSNL